MLSKLKGVASWYMPCSAPALPAMDSTIIPIVMRDGIAWGLTMMSGIIPVLAQNGISSSATTAPIVPFCPCRDEN